MIFTILIPKYIFKSNVANKNNPLPNGQQNVLNNKQLPYVIIVRYFNISILL